MKILLIADMHDRRDWYDWLIREAAGYDLVCIAGDFVNAFAPDVEGQEKYLLEDWLPRFTATGVPLALCSGNHDDPGVTWASHAPREKFVTDGETRLLSFPINQKLVVTTCPNNKWGGDSFMVNLWTEGARLRDEEEGPWLVLCHEPPWEISPSEDLSSMWLTRNIAQYHPDFVSCGHFHETENFPFAARVGTTWCTNAGQDLRAPRPNYIVLDLAARTATRVRMVPLRGAVSWVERRELLEVG